MSRYVTLTGILFFMIVVNTSVYSAPTHKRSKKSPRIMESVTSVANCAEGHVISGSVKTSAKKVEIVDETKVGCNAAGQCSAYQVTAKRPDGEPFNIEVTVTCTEDGLDTELDRALESLRQEAEAQKGENR